MLIITTGCATVQKVDYVLPPKPERQTIPAINTIKDVAKVIVYYESLVREWEEWGASVEEIIR